MDTRRDDKERKGEEDEEKVCALFPTPSLLYVSQLGGFERHVFVSF